MSDRCTLDEAKVFAAGLDLESGVGGMQRWSA